MLVERSNTKIVCTIGPSSCSEQILHQLARAGMSVARLNLSHGTAEKQMEILRRIRTVSSRTGVPIGILADLPGPRIRVGSLSREPLDLQDGSYLTLTARHVVGNPRLVSITHPSVLRELGKGDPVFLADGTIRLTVEHVTHGEAICRVTRGGALFSGKGVNVPGKQLGLRTLTPKDVGLMRLAMKNGADFIGLSFTTSAGDIARAKRIVKQAHCQAGSLQRSKNVKLWKTLTRSYGKPMVRW